MQMQSIHEYDVESSSYGIGASSQPYSSELITPEMTSFKPDSKDDKLERTNNNISSSSKEIVDKDEDDSDDEEKSITENEKPVLESDDIELQEDCGGIQNEGLV